MKQILLRNGKAIVEEVPAPQALPGQILVRTAWSCLSPGTELATAESTSMASFLGSIRHNPSLARKALNTVRDKGIQGLNTKVLEKITYCTPSGYSCAGTVLMAGFGVDDIAVGDPVACAGGGYANHAEIVAVPRNLVVRVPDGVELKDAATVALGAIALQGVRRARVALGERIGVIGLGFLGQLTVQLLKAAGCRIFGTDTDRVRVEQAKAFGLIASPEGGNIAKAAQRFSDGYGLDAVLITASTTSDEPLYLAMQMTRRKGRVVVVGDVGLKVRRDAMYAKELDLVISTSYGPGRYDSSYEENGFDYPYAYVRWTENRNMQAYLEMIAAEQVKPAPLTARILPVKEAAKGYRALREENPRPYTVLLEYPADNKVCNNSRVTVRAPGPTQAGTVRLAVVGAGNFARNVHLPNLRNLANRFSIEAIVTGHGPTAMTTARQVGATSATTDYRDVLADSGVDAILIATRHHLHAEMVEAALRAGKHVFVEKPLALTEKEVDKLENVFDELQKSPVGCPVVLVGFNRRYSPYAVHLRELIAERTAPLHLIYRINAGYLPPDHWVHGTEGGGRVLGEACHIIDLFRFLIGASAVQVNATGVRTTDPDVSTVNNFTATVRYAEGSVCTLLYTSQGGQELPKEYLELHGDGRSFLLDDYRLLKSFGANLKIRTRKPEKGHREELIVFHQMINGALDRRALWENAVEVSRTALEVDRQLRGR